MPSKRKTKLSRSTPSARRIKLKRKNELPEKRQERYKKDADRRRTRLAAESPEQSQSRRRQMAQRAREKYFNKMEKLKSERRKAVFDAIEASHKAKIVKTKRNSSPVYPISLIIIKREVKQMYKEEDPIQCPEIDDKELLIDVKQKIGHCD